MGQRPPRPARSDTTFSQFSWQSAVDTQIEAVQFVIWLRTSHKSSAWRKTWSKWECPSESVAQRQWPTLGALSNYYLSNWQFVFFLRKRKSTFRIEIKRKIERERVAQSHQPMEAIHFDSVIIVTVIINIYFYLYIDIGSARNALPSIFLWPVLHAACSSAPCASWIRYTKSKHTQRQHRASPRARATSPVTKNLPSVSVVCCVCRAVHAIQLIQQFIEC